MAELLVLDPAEVSLSRAAFDITSYVGETGPDWGDAAIEQFLADVQVGQIPVDYRLPNRTITIPLLLRTDPLVSFDTLRKRVQQKSGLFQREGGWVKRTTSLGPLFAEVVGAQLKLGGSTAQALWGIDADAVLTLTTLPDWYGNEIVETAQSSSVNTSDLIFTILGGQSALFSSYLLSLGPALYWRLGANGLVDQSGNARNGTAVGGLTVGGVAGALADDIDAATDFDGVDDRVTSTYNPFVNGTTRTFAGVAWRDNLSAQHALFGSDVASGNVMCVLTAGTNSVSFSVDGTTFVTWAGAWPIENLQWVHWALIFNETTNVAELFVNGVSKGTRSVAQAYNASPGNLKLGTVTASNQYPFDGKMDEFAVWARALTPAEVLTLARHAVGKGVPGELPVRARLVLTEQAGVDLRGLLWGVRSRNYSSDATARLAYEAEALTPIAPAASGANATATGGNEVFIGALAKDWTAVLSTDLAGVGSLTHVGSYRMWARVRTTAVTTPPKVRLVWDVGDLLNPVANDPVRLPFATDWWLADLGEVRLDPAPIGTHRWQGVIQAADGDHLFGVDKIWLQPLDEGAGKLSVSSALTVGLTGYSARDEFDQTAGNLTGKTLPIGGGTWTYGTGDTDDFTVDATNHRVQRTTVSDTANRLMLASTPSLAAAAGQIDFYISAPAGGGAWYSEMVCRYVDANNYAYVYVGGGAGLGRVYVTLAMNVAGVFSNLSSTIVPEPLNAWWTLRVLATAKGYLYAWLFPQGSTPPSQPIVSRADSVFATGGALASGKIGFGDQNSSGAVSSRYYDNFMVWVPDIDAVMFANRGAELRHDGMFREAPGGANYAPIAVTGDLLRLPPSGLEGRMTEIFLKPSIGDLDQGADSSLSYLIQAQMRHRPSYLFVPEG
jgi:Concanavalin A-like lectin/glucanases superfamily